MRLKSVRERGEGRGTTPKELLKLPTNREELPGKLPTQNNPPKKEGEKSKQKIMRCFPTKGQTSPNQHFEPLTTPGTQERINEARLKQTT